MGNFNKFFALTVFLLFTIGLTEKLHAQRVYSVIFNDLPQDSQLFPRNNNNIANIPIKGIIEVPGWTYLSVILTREGKNYGYSRGYINYTSSTLGNFSVPNVNIKAEPAEYEISIYAMNANGKDSLFMTSRQHLVAGDFYVLNGQSNAYAFNIGNEPFFYDNKYIRTFGKHLGQVSDTLWVNPSPQVGALALSFQKYIFENTGIPTCIINGSVPGTGISQHFRDDTYPTNLGTIYGSLLYRIQKSRAIDKIKGFIWIQGENDIFDNSTTYPDDFKRLFKSWQMDYPTVDQYIVTQSNVYPIPTTNAASIRNFQRQTPLLSSKIEVLALNGYETLDGVHHTNKGYFQISARLYKIFGAKYYGLIDDINNHSPNVKRAYFTSSKHDAVAIEFPEGTEMVAVPDTVLKSPYTGNIVTLGIKDYIYFDNDESRTATITRIDYSGNKVIFNFNNPISFSKIDYLPGRYYTFDFTKYMGPSMRSKNDLHACSFYDLAIESENTAPLLSPSLTATALYFDKVNLTWNKVDKAVNYVLEVQNGGIYQVIATLDSSMTSWIHQGLLPSTLYTYRIKAINATQTSSYNGTTVTTTALLDSPVISASQVAIGEVKVIWGAVKGANSYLLERSINGTTFSGIGTFNSTTFSYADTKVAYGLSYTYRLKAFGTGTESPLVTTSIKVVSELVTPVLKQNAIYTYGSGIASLEIGWKSVDGATSYQLERKQAGQAYQILNNLDNAKNSYNEQSLAANTSYTYRIKAKGNFTESKYDSLTVLTPNVLTTPTLAVEENLTNKTLSISWNSVTGASTYQFTRNIEGQSTSLKTTLSTNKLVDSTFIQKANYTYKLQAFGANTESAVATKTFTTSLILGNEPLAVESLVYPNPCHDFVWIRLPYSTSGGVDFIDTQGRIVKSVEFKNQELLEVSLQNLPIGIYFTRVQTAKAIWNTKILVN